MARVLIVSADGVGSRMAGTGIRYRELARVLGADHDVELVAPESDLADVGTYDLARPRPLLARVAAADVVISPSLPAGLARAVRRAARRWIVDLYCPEPLETLELLRADGRLSAWARRALVDDSLAVALAGGDAFVCAGERQRDLWLGALMARGRLTRAAYAADRTLRELIDVVPFGLPEQPPHPAPEAVMKGRWPGVGADDRVVLWTGGVWDWLDAETAVDAAVLLARSEPGARLVFLGTRRPGGAPMGAGESRARALADSLGASGRTVIFHDGWVPYAERAGYLLEADVGLTLHRDIVEARFAFRTRLLDHLWTGLPTVATRGDELAGVLAAHGGAELVAPGDAAGVAEALGRALARPRAEVAAALSPLRERFAWERVAEPLARLVDGEGGRPRPRPGALAAPALRDRALRGAARLAGLSGRR